MRKTVRELREEADLAFELDHIAIEEDESSEDGDDKVPPRRRGLACFIDVFANFANLFRQVFGIKCDSENVYVSGEPEINQLDEEISEIIYSRSANGSHRIRVVE